MQPSTGSAGRRLAWAMALAGAALLPACGGGGGDGPLPQGTLRIALTDAPSCYEKVIVSVEKVRVHKGSQATDAQEGWAEIVPPNAPVEIDLLALTNGALADLGSAQVDAGTYRVLRLVLSQRPGANRVRLPGGAEHALQTPSAQQSGLKIRASFDVGVDATTDMLLDFDACASVLKAGNSGQYILKPVVRLARKAPGAIHGQLAAALALGTTSVSAQQDGEVVRSTSPDATGRFNLAFLPAGSYTVVITAPDAATGVVTGVPVGSAATAISDAGSAIALPASTPMHVVDGQVVRGGIVRSAIGDATVAARQAIAGGTIQVASTTVDFDLGTYQLKLPADDPVRAPFRSSGLVFSADTSAAGKYTLQASAPDRATQSRTVDSRAAPTSTVDFVY